MGYAITAIWNDDVESSFLVESTEEKNMYIKILANSREFKALSYCKIYDNGVYGKRKVVL